ncbi:GTPase IMAP family member 9-like [Thunnus thynnus]|uniref:GTPase IMAP family member 9-like n=1 Tax=Thunnus thynnus TaxID=8237 RepID=UPI003527AF28
MANNLVSGRTNNEELRIVMLGKTGIGKSASGNTILGRDCFKSKRSAKSMTVHCSKEKAEVDGRRVAVIDTPGLFDTRCDQDKTIEDICQCLTYAAPGPHIFLVVIGLDRFTEEEKQTVQKIQEIFGQDADRYSMVLFTHGDDLEDTTIEEFLDESEDLQEVVARCNGQYHVFNNKLKDGAQVTKLLHKIRNVVQNNGGSHYTSEMFQEAERAIEEKKQHILKEKEEQLRREQEEMERKSQEKYQKEIKEMNEKLQDEREQKERELRKMKEQHEKKIKEEREKLQQKYDNEARKQAEEFNPLHMLVKAGKLVGKATLKTLEVVGKATVKTLEKVGEVTVKTAEVLGKAAVNTTEAVGGVVVKGAEVVGEAVVKSVVVVGGGVIKNMLK